MLTETTELICAHTSITSSSAFTFKKGSTTIYQKSDTDTSKYEATASAGKITLLIKDLSVSDEGNYICNAVFQNSDPYSLELNGK